MEVTKGVALSESSGSKAKAKMRLKNGGQDVGDTSNNRCDPLETRLVECKSENAVISKVPALSEKWAPSSSMKWVEFFVPADFDEENLTVWQEFMELYVSDLCWLLKMPHHIFWSSLVYCPEINDSVLNSFLKCAPRFYDSCYTQLEQNPVFWPVYQKIYLLIFRIYLRLATYKENKECHITPATWVRLLRDHNLVSICTLKDLATLYESKENVLFVKMVENLMNHDSRLMTDLRSEIPLLSQKLGELYLRAEKLMEESTLSGVWNAEDFSDVIAFQLDAVFSLWKFLKACPAASKVLLHYPSFVTSMATSYDLSASIWGDILSHLPELESSVSTIRTATIRLYRMVLATPTILAVESSNDKRLDEYFDYFSQSIDEKIFIHDYEKMYPFRNDIHSLLQKGIFVDETTIDHMAHAISYCFHSCGEEYSVEKLMVDPLYDPNFDRQLLGACSLEVTGVELQSLVTQVRDLLPDLPNSYVEAVLKHFGYNVEKTVSSLLEGTVPKRLEKYKSDEYLNSQSSSSVVSGNSNEDHLPDKLPAAINIETLLAKKKKTHGDALDRKMPYRKGCLEPSVAEVEEEESSKLYEIQHVASSSEHPSVTDSGQGNQEHLHKKPSMFATSGIDVAVVRVSEVELQTLASQVRDLLPDLSVSYAQAVLMNYDCNVEKTVSNLLEGTVPEHLEKYKSEEFIPSHPDLPENVLLEEERGSFFPTETFRPNKKHPSVPDTASVAQSFQEFHDDKPSVRTESGVTSRSQKKQIVSDKTSYISEDLLPPIDQDASAEYDDEYDDSYDDVGAGMTEPDNISFKPLNFRKAELHTTEDETFTNVEDEASSRNQTRDATAFCEDPAVIRARFERRREELRNRKHGGNRAPFAQGDVVGRAKGQGQSSDVVHNRRQKNIQKGGGGSYRRRADNKRREF